MNRTDLPAARIAAGVVLAIVVSIAVNTGIAFGTRAVETGGTRIGLTPVAYAPATALGIIVATIGWTIVRRRTARPAALLRVLVPAVLVVSLVPGVILLVLGNSALNVLGLWIMHLIVAAVTVTTLSRVLPVADRTDEQVGAAGSYA